MTIQADQLQQKITETRARLKAMRNELSALEREAWRETNTEKRVRTLTRSEQLMQKIEELVDTLDILVVMHPYVDTLEG